MCRVRGQRPRLGQPTAHLLGGRWIASCPTCGCQLAKGFRQDRVDQDQVRQHPTGEADLIVRGVDERIQIIRTKIPESCATVARA